MSTQIQRRRGTTSGHSTFIGASGEITIDTTKNTVVVHDGTTAGGFPLLKEGGLTAGTGITVSGTTITNAAPDQTVSLTGGTGISTSGTYPNFTVTNTAPDQTVVLTEGANVTVTGTYPNFTIASTDQFTGTVTSISGTGTVNGLSLSGTITDSGNITLSGTLSATVSEISDLTATASELNILDGVTATTAEINYLDITTLGTSEASKALTADANGDVVLSEELIAKSYNETFVTLSGTTPTVDCEAGNSFTITLSGNTTFTFSNPPANGTAFAFTLKLVQDAGASGYTVTWPASVDYAGATAPTLTADANAVDVLVFYTHDGGTNWYGFLSGGAMA